MKRNMILGMVAITLLSLSTMTGCGSSGAESTEGIVVKPVAVMELREEYRPLTLHYMGITEAKETIKYSFKSSGKVAEVFVEEGQQVKKGDKLALLEGEDLQYSLDAAKAQMEAAKAQYDKAVKGARHEEIRLAELDLRKAQANYDFVKDYYEKIKIIKEAGGVSELELLETALKMDQAKNSLEQAQKILELTKRGTRDEDLETLLKQYEIAQANYEVLGTYNYYVLPKQENPYVQANAAIITTVYPGASPQDVEQLVTKKIEDAVSELSEYKKVSSESGKNVSVVLVLYNDEAHIDAANRELREKMDEVKGKLPHGCREPEINTDLAEAAGMLISLSGSNYTYEQLTFYAEEIKGVIGEIDGIYKTELVGNVDKQVTVKVDMDKLNQFDISLSEIDQLLYLQNLEIPSGALENEHGKISVKTRGSYQSIDDMGDTIIAVSSETGAVVRLRDIASVELELKDDVAKCKQGEENAVIVAGYFQEEKNIMPIGKKVREALANVSKSLPQDMVLTEVTFQPENVKNSIGTFVSQLIMGMVLVVVVIFIGMGPGNAVVVSLAIPFTLAMTFMLMNATDVKLQSVLLAGLIVALGMIVDNAVVVSDAVKVEYEHGESKENAAIKAASSVAMPVFTSTLTTMAAFVRCYLYPVLWENSFQACLQ